jgi:hypothetical protein
MQSRLPSDSSVDKKTHGKPDFRQSFKRRTSVLVCSLFKTGPERSFNVIGLS